MQVLLIPGFMLDSDLGHEVEGELNGCGPFFHADLSQDGAVEAMAARALADAPPAFALVMSWADSRKTGF